MTVMLDQANVLTSPPCLQDPDRWCAGGDDPELKRSAAAAPGAGRAPTRPCIPRAPTGCGPQWTFPKRGGAAPSRSVSCARWPPTPATPANPTSRDGWRPLSPRTAPGFAAAAQEFHRKRPYLLSVGDSVHWTAAQRVLSQCISTPPGWIEAGMRPLPVGRPV